MTTRYDIAPQHPLATSCPAGRISNYRRIKCESPKGVHLGLNASTLFERKGSLSGEIHDRSS